MIYLRIKVEYRNRQNYLSQGLSLTFLFIKPNLILEFLVKKMLLATRNMYCLYIGKL